MKYKTRQRIATVGMGVSLALAAFTPHAREHVQSRLDAAQAQSQDIDARIHADQTQAAKLEKQHKHDQAAKLLGEVATLQTRADKLSAYETTTQHDLDGTKHATRDLLIAAGVAGLAMGINRVLRTPDQVEQPQQPHQPHDGTHQGA